MAFDQKLIDEYARAQVAKQQYLDQGRKDLADNADRYRNQVSQKLASQGFKVDSNADLSGDYIKKHGDGAAGKYDTGQQGQVLKREPRPTSSSSSRPPSRSFDDDLATSLARSKLEFDPYRQELRVDEASGRKYMPTLAALQFLSGQRQQQYANTANDRSFAFGRDQQELENDRSERAFTAQQQQQQYANRQAEMSRNIGLAESFAERYGITIDPKQDYRYLNEQVKGLKPLTVQQMDAQERDRLAANQARQQGISIDWARLGDSREERAADNARQTDNQNQQRLFDIWEKTGVAPAGIPDVKPGTPVYSSRQQSVNENDVYAEAIGNLNTMTPDQRKMFFSGEEESLIRTLGPSGYNQLYNRYFDEYGDPIQQGG